MIDNFQLVARWKVHESTLLGIGSLSKLIVDDVSTNKLPLDINTFLQNVVLVDLNQNGESRELLLVTEIVKCTGCWLMLLPTSSRYMGTSVF